MSEESLEVGINASGNFISVLERAVKQSERLTNSLSDLVDLLKDANRAQGEFESRTSKVAEATKKVASSSADAVSDVKKLKEALTKTGDEARDALKELDFSKVSLGKLSTAEIEKLAGLLREAGSNLSQFMESGKVEDLEFTRALDQLNELRGLLEQPASLNIDFDSSQQVIAQLGKEVGDVFEKIRNPESSGAFSQRDFLVLALTKTQEELRATSSRAETLREKLREIGPEAAQGGAQAVKKFIEMKSELQEAEKNAARLQKQLRDTFEFTFQQQNLSLQNLGLKPLRAEDIFPSAEQQKLTEIRNRIDSAVRENVETSAVQGTLNFFLNANNQIGDMDRNIVRLTSTLPRLRYALYDVSNTLGIMGGALAGVSIAAAKVGIDFQRMFADVERTISVDRATEVGRKQIQALEKDLVSLTQAIPVSFDEITRIATLAGQLNIATGNVAEFTETVAKFVATSDVTVDAAATAFGRLDQLVAGVDGQFEKLGAAISAVGINAVATESEIIAISTQIASVANIAGFGAGELVGFASALASVGTRPELARGTFTRLFTEISQAAAGTKDTLGDFARIAGRSAEDFQAAWGRGEGPEIVVDILKGLQKEGRGAELALRELGITSVRDVPTLLKLAQGVEDVERQLAVAQIAFIEGTELQRQYSIVSSTVSEKLQVLKNTFQALIATIGSSAGSLGFLVDAFIKFFTIIQKIIDNPINRFIVGLTAAIVGLVGGFGLLLAALTRAGAGFAGLLTASTETSKAIALTRLNVQGLNADLSATSATAGVASASVKGFGVAAATTGKASLTASSGAAVLSGGRSGFRLVTKTANEATRANKGLSSSLFGVFKATKLAPFAALTLKVVALYAGVLLAVAGINELGKRFNWWGGEIENVNDKFGDLSPLLSSVRRDTENFNSGITESAEGLIFFRGEVESSNIELSRRGKTIAIVTGQEELLEQAVDGSSTAIKNQTLVIGENTLALIKQKIAQDLLSKSQEKATSAANIRRDIALSRGEAPSGQPSLLRDIARMEALRGEAGAQVGLASIFNIVGDPQLGRALKEAGFDISEFFDLVARGNEDAAKSLLNNLVPAAEEMRETLLDSGLSETADEITYLDGIIAFGVQGLKEYTSAGSELMEAVKALTFEQALMGDGLEDTAEAVQAFRDALKSAVDDAYYMVNAQRDMEDAIEKVGAAFATESPEVVANSREMQAAIKSIIDTASSTDEAIEGLSGFFNAIVEGGFASEQDLKILQEQIISTLRTTLEASRLSLIEARKQIEASLALARTARAAQSVINGIRVGPSGSPAAGNAALAKANADIRDIENSLSRLDGVLASTGASAIASEKLASGYNNAKDAARGTANAAKDVADNTKEAAEEVRTLLDYASDLDKVIKRAFDIRFKAALQVDKVADSWDGLADNIRNAREEVDDLIRSQRDLAADRAIKEYFLSIAEIYDDQLRASKLRAEISELDAKAAENTRKLVEKGFVGDIDTGDVDLFNLEDDSAVARRNRAALGGLVREYQDYVIALAESGASQDELRKATERARKEFIAQATDLGFAEDAVLKYAVAFDDLTFAINNIPRNVTIEADVNPALTALRELQAQQIRNIELANDLNAAMGATGGGSTPRPTTPSTSNNADMRRSVQQEISQLQNSLSVLRQEGARLSNLLRSAPALARPTIRSQISTNDSRIRAVEANIQDARNRLARLATGGLVQGPGGPTEDKVPAMLSAGEYVVKAAAVRKFGVPFFNELNQMRAPQFITQSFVGGSTNIPDAMMVELSPFDRQLLAQAGNVQLRLDGRVVAQASNRNNVASAQRGSN